MVLKAIEFASDSSLDFDISYFFFMNFFLDLVWRHAVAVTNAIIILVKENFYSILFAIKIEFDSGTKGQTRS
jgi:hypothetical protein